MLTITLLLACSSPKTAVVPSDASNTSEENPDDTATPPIDPEASDEPDDPDSSTPDGFHSAFAVGKISHDRRRGRPNKRD